MTLKLSPESYAAIEAKIDLKNDEDYAVVVQRRHSKVTYGVFVFERQPSTKEMITYEETASRVKYKGSHAEVQGSAILAAKNLFNTIVARGYDIQIGRVCHDELDRDECRAKVPDLVKRAAVREFLGNVDGLTSMTESEGDDDAPVRPDGGE